MYPLKQSTAITLPFFVHDASGDAVTGLLDGGFTKRISKGSGAFAAMTVTVSEMENGWYSIPLSTSHSDTLGLLTIVFTHASSKQVNLQFRVHVSLPDDVANDVWDEVATGHTTADTFGLQARRTHALSGGTKMSQDAAAANPTVVTHRNEADAADLVTLTTTEVADVTTITPT